jgi:pyrrolysine biosynthesis protein PylC
VKPSDRSGSEGVQVVCNREELDHILSHNRYEDLILEEFLEGPSYSIEVIGFAGKYHVFQITELEMDRKYDCKRVLAPAKLDQSLMKQFNKLAFKLAREISLNGIMDVETILHKGKLKVLEIDARLPSQTPTAIYHSTGINQVECLGYTFFKQGLHIPLPKRAAKDDQYVIYEHFSVSPEKIEVCGEHALTLAGPLSIYTDFFGADEVLTDYIPGKMRWVLTLITRGTSRAETWKKRNDVLKNIQERFRIPRIIDPYPLCLNKGVKRNDSSQRKRY